MRDSVSGPTIRSQIIPARRTNAGTSITRDPGNVPDAGITGNPRSALRLIRMRGGPTSGGGAQRPRAVLTAAANSVYAVGSVSRNGEMTLAITPLGSIT